MTQSVPQSNVSLLRFRRTQIFVELRHKSDLKKIGEYENTLIVVTADHGHGFVRPPLLSVVVDFDLLLAIGRLWWRRHQISGCSDH